MNNDNLIKVCCYTNVKQSDIMYLEADWNYTYVHTSYKKFLSSHTLKTFSNRINPYDFVKINRGLLINKQFIRSLKKETKYAFIKLVDGRELPISRRMYNTVKDELSITLPTSTN